MRPPPDDPARRRRHRNERIAAALFVLLAAAGLAAFLRWNAREQKTFERNRLYIPREATITPEIVLLQEYLRIPTLTGSEKAGAEWLARQLGRHGIRSELIESAPGRVNVYARIRGKRPGEGLLLLQHIDVVPARPPEWELPPFAAEIKLNQLYGRGVLDMKGIGLTHLLAFIDVAKSGRVPERDLVFLATADEEAGGKLGIVRLLETRPDLFQGIRYALNEGGLNEIERESMTYFGIEIGGKQYSNVIVAADTLEQLRLARIALERYADRREPQRILPEVRQFFRSIAPARHFFQQHLADVDAAVANGTFWKMPASYRELTYDVTMMRWPVPRNGRYEAQIDLIDLPDTAIEDRLAWLDAQLAPFGARVVSVPLRSFRSPLSPADTPLFRIVAEQARTQYSTRTGTYLPHRAMNDSRYLRLRGIVSYGVLPFPVDAFQSLSIHQPNERVRLDWFMEGVGFLKDVVRAYVYAPALT